MTVNDGYGDNLPDHEVIARFEKWAHSVAGNLTNPYRPLYDDVVQEALVEAWRILAVKGGKAAVSATYLTMNMRRRMRDVANGRPMYGGDRRPGPRTEPPATVSLDALAAGRDRDEDVDLTELRDGYAHLLHAADLVESVQLAYHDGDIGRALAELSPADRRYVTLRFWQGMSDVEIAALLGADKRNVGQSWHRRIKPRLREQLAHLADAV
jgi:RNA polymerase sigma factor (sigma-70 family)